MPTDPPAPDNRPLNLTDLDEHGQAPLYTLAERVIGHLDGDWSVQPHRHCREATLERSDGLRLTFSNYGPAPYSEQQFHVATYTATGRVSEKTTPMGVYTLPSQIAACLASDVIPAAEKRLVAARRQQQRLQERNEGRKARIAAIAERLDWNSSSYKCHSEDPYPSLPRSIGRRRRRGAAPPVLNGSIGYDDDAMHLYLRGLPEPLIDQIVDLVADHLASGETATEQ